MLEFLQKQTVYAVEAVNIEGDEVTLICQDALPMGEVVKVKDSEGKVASLSVSNARRTDLGVWLCFAQIIEGNLGVKVEWPEPQRSAPRLEVGLRVRSEQIPGFSALTHDLSAQGMQVLSEGPMNVGETITLALDLDGDREALELTAVVRWCKINPPCSCGLLFLDLSPATKHRLAEYLDYRALPDHVVPRLSDSLRELDEASNVIQTSATLLDAYRMGQQLVLRLRTQEETLDFKFLEATVLISEVEGCEIRKITSETCPDGLSLFSFYDQRNRLVLQLESGPPEIVVSQNVEENSGL